MSVARSLFEAPSPSVVEPAGRWGLDLLVGPLVITLCVLAVAMLGFLMLGGQLSVRRGFKVVIGCFVLLGAPTIASAFLETGASVGGEPMREMVIVPDDGLGARRPLPPTPFDPYAGASLRKK